MLRDEMQWLHNNAATVIDNTSGKSGIWCVFGKIYRGQYMVLGFVACRACLKVCRKLHTL